MSVVGEIDSNMVERLHKTKTGCRHLQTNFTSLLLPINDLNILEISQKKLRKHFV